MAVGDIYQVRALWLMPSTGLTSENSFYFSQVTDPPTLGPEKDLVARFIAECEASYMAVIHNNYGINRYSVYLYPEKLLSYVELRGDLAGALTGDQLPPDQAQGLNLRTATLGRRGRGKLYLGPSSEARNLSIGKPDATSQQLAEALGANLAAMADADPAYAEWQWGVWSITDQLFRPITSYDAATIWWTQRGRKR